MNAIIYQSDYDGLNRRLDTVDRTLAWLETKGRSSRRLDGEKAELMRRLLRLEDLIEYDKLD